MNFYTVTLIFTPKTKEKNRDPDWNCTTYVLGKPHFKNKTKKGKDITKLGCWSVSKNQLDKNGFLKVPGLLLKVTVLVV